MWEIGEPQEKEVPRPGTRAEQAGCADICPVSDVKRNTFRVKGSIKNFGLRRSHKASQHRCDLRGCKGGYEF